MRNIQLFLVICVFFNLYSLSSACKGCLSLDDHNFQKIITRFKAVLVKFDISYPYGEKHEAFSKLAEELVDNNEVILAQVPVKDYGDKENFELAKKYGFENKDQLPGIKLFIGSVDKFVEFPKDSEWSVDNLRNVIRDNTDIYLGLPGCLEDYDKLAMNFVASGNKESQIKQAEKLVDDVKEENKETAKIYVKFMKKVVENGIAFVRQEIERLNKIIKEGKMTEKKKKELSNRVNILHSFAIKKDEL